jgi:hypothetical protein
VSTSLRSKRGRLSRFRNVFVLHLQNVTEVLLEFLISTRYFFSIDVPMRLRQFLERQRKACAPQYPGFGQVLAACEVWRKSCRGAETFGD